LGPGKEIPGPEPYGSLAITDAKNAKDFFEAQKRYYTEEIPDKPFSFYGSFAKAYEYLKKRKYAESYRILKERSWLYAYDEPTFWDMPSILTLNHGG
jgi:GDP-D-mannose dehydratase